MTTTVKPTKAEKTNVLTAENKKGIENHKKAAKHHEEAAKHHLNAAKHHEAGDHGKAAQSTIKAQGHLHHVSKALREDAKQHAMNN